MRLLAFAFVFASAFQGAFIAEGFAEPTKKALPKASDFVELGASDSSDSSDSEEANEKAGSKAADNASSKAAENEKVLTGTVRVLRKITQTEVFFKDINDSYVIPSGNAYYSIYKAFTESQKKGTAVSFRANTKTRRVLSIAEGPEVPSEGSGSGAGSSGQGSGSAASGSSKNSGSK